MGKKLLLLLLCLGILLFPLYSFFQMEWVTGGPAELNDLQSALRGYQISIWISWIVLVSTAIYYKWTEKSNLFFIGTYAFLVLAHIVFGVYTQRMVTIYKLPSRFEDLYTLGLFVAIQNILVSIILTGFLQAGVWWFTRRWHRR